MEPDELLEYLVEELVNNPDEVHVESHITAHTANFDIHVAYEDVGLALGRQGIHAKSLRTLFGAIYGKRGMRLNLQVVDPRR